MVLYIPGEIPDFGLKFFDFQGKEPVITFIDLNKEFCNDIKDFFSKPNKCGLAEEVGKRFFELKGYKVRENYRLRGSLSAADLTIFENDKEVFVEMKSFNDKVSLKQLELIIRFKGLIGFLIEKPDMLDLDILRYKKVEE